MLITLELDHPVDLRMSKETKKNSIVLKRYFLHLFKQPVTKRLLL